MFGLQKPNYTPRTLKTKYKQTTSFPPFSKFAHGKLAKLKLASDIHPMLCEKDDIHN